MKKFLSLLLAAMMLLSCATAMASSVAADADTIQNGSAYWKEESNEIKDDNSVTGDDANSDIDVREETTTFKDSAGFDTKGEAATEIWLQVDATGQIDVTVPLVLVFQTNIDGGHATSPSAYKITNHSTADLVVTKIVTREVVKHSGITNYNNQPMTLAAYPEIDATTGKIKQPAEDVYGARINVAKGVTLGKLKDDKTNTGVYDLFTSANLETPHENAAARGGLFELQKPTAGKNADGMVTNLNVEMITGPLSFVTTRTDDDTNVDTDKGIQLLTIVYTVAIDTSDAIGETIHKVYEADSTTDTNGNKSNENFLEDTVSNASELNDKD